jgi:glutamate decarboxylase
MKRIAPIKAQSRRNAPYQTRNVALYLSAEIGKLEPFQLITNGSDIPVFCWTMKEAYAKKARFTLYDLADKLRERGWLVPAYPMPRNRQDLVVQRVVVKEDFSRDLAERLLEDIQRAVAYFESQPKHKPKTHGTHFRH